MSEPEATRPSEAPEVVIKARHNGPYKVTGPVTIVDADGSEYELPDDGRPVALCRCGGSTTKPFCDGTHSKIGFDAAERAVHELKRETEPAPTPERPRLPRTD
jgi:CDGSH-type Zn-finger protein